VGNIPFTARRITSSAFYPEMAEALSLEPVRIPAVAHVELGLTLVGRDVDLARVHDDDMVAGSSVGL